VASDDAEAELAAYQEKLARLEELRSSVGPIEEVTAQVEALEETARLYAAQLERLDELQTAAWRHELTIHELAAAPAAEPPPNGTGQLYMAPVDAPGPPPYRELVRDARALQSRAQALMEEVELLRPKARSYEALLEELKQLRPKARNHDKLLEEVKLLRPRARSYDKLREEVTALRQKARRLDELTGAPEDAQAG